MSVPAISIRIVYENLAATDYKFQSTRAGSIMVGSIQTVNGNWAFVNDNTMSWDGANPTITNTDGVARTVNSLRVGDGGGGAGNAICVIPHAGVELGAGDTIIYTSIQISFTTVDIP